MVTNFFIIISFSIQILVLETRRMSITVLYEGVRKSIRIDQNAPVQSIIQSCSEEFKVQSLLSRLQLRHKKSILDPSQPFRFCNVPNNSVVELIIAQVNTKNIDGSRPDATLAVTVTGVGSVTLTVSSSVYLNDLVGMIGNKLSISGDVDSEIILFSRCIPRSDYATLTLFDLGLAGQRARIQLRLLGNQDSVKELGSSSSSIDVCEKVCESKNLIESNNNDLSLMQDRSEVTSPSAEAFMSPQSINNTENSPPPIVQLSNETNVDLREEKQSSNNSPPSVQDALLHIQQNNFDAVAIPGLILILKYMSNILSNPMEEKYRSINVQNKVFREKIHTMKGGIVLLWACGFQPVFENSNRMSSEAGVSIFNSSIYRNDNPELVSMVYPNSPLLALEANFQIVTQWTTDMGVESTLIPMIKNQVSGKGESNLAASQVAAVPFDPFKSSIVRNSEQVRNLMTTERSNEEIFLVNMLTISLFDVFL